MIRVEKRDGRAEVVCGNILYLLTVRKRWGTDIWLEIVGFQ